MLTAAMLKALNDQVQKELYSSYLYLSMATDLEDKNFGGFASWMKAQAEEEREHGMKIFDYILERGSRVTLEAIAKPPAEFGTVKQTMQAVLDHEKQVTASVHALYELALAEKDYPSQIFLQWFVTEQAEEEKTAEEVLSHLDILENKQHPLLIMDRQMGKRGKS